VEDTRVRVLQGVVCNELRASNQIVADIATDAAIKELLASDDFWKNVASNADTKIFAADFAALNLLAAKINANDGTDADATAAFEAIKSFPVEMNPHYGTWDGESLSIGSGSLSVPVAEASAVAE
jgi:hypothetical protein